MPFDVRVANLNKIDAFLKKAGKVPDRAQVFAINHAAKKGRTLGGKKIREQVNLKTGYVNERLKVTKKASKNNPTAVITGRGRATQLIRFTKNAGVLRKGQQGLSGRRRSNRRAKVQVKTKGTAKSIKAFYVKLKGGNEGIAFRTKGKFSTGNTKFKVLYGPSVDQVFSGVRNEIEDEVAGFAVTEFERQYDRLINGI